MAFVVPRRDEDRIRLQAGQRVGNLHDGRRRPESNANNRSIRGRNQARVVVDCSLNADLSVARRVTEDPLLQCIGTARWSAATLRCVDQAGLAE